MMLMNAIWLIMRNIIRESPRKARKRFLKSGRIINGKVLNAAADVVGKNELPVSTLNESFNYPQPRN